ncbi:MAG: hypothetical protein ACI4SK_04865 [Christensenellales bacterium]
MKKSLRIVVLIFILSFAVVLLASCSVFGDKDNAKKEVFAKEMIVTNPIADTQFVYSGKEIKFDPKDFYFKVNGQSVSSSDFIFTYENNVNAGNTAKLIITAKPENKYCTGSVDLYFTILPGSAKIYRYEEFLSYINDPNYGDFELWATVEIAEDETLSIPEGKTLRILGNQCVTVYGKLINNGRIIVDGSLYSTGVVASGMIDNRGYIENHGDFSITKRGIVYNFNSFNSTTKFINEGNVYTFDKPLENIENTAVGKQYVRKKLAPENVNIEYTTKEYDEKFSSFCPAISIIGSYGHYNTVYSDNEHVGTASVLITMDDFDTQYYGEVSVPFTITKGKTTVYDYTEYAKKIASEDFKEYVLTGNLEIPAAATVTLNEGEKLDLKSHEFVISGKFTNNGTIISSSDTNKQKYSLTVRKNGEFVNGGVFSAQNGNATVNGFFENDSSSPLVFDRFFVNGSFINKSELSSSYFSLNANASFFNESGSAFTTGKLYNYAKIDNSGNLSAEEYTYFSENAQLQNNQGGSVAFATETIIQNVNIKNYGAIINRGDFFCENFTTFENGENGFDNSSGHIWTYDALQNVNENVTVKAKLSAENTSLSFETIEYNEETQTVQVFFDGKPPIDGSYNIIYSDDVINVGTVHVTIEVTERKSSYGGSYEASFEITKGTYEATDPNLIVARLNNPNYEKIILMDDIALPSTSILGNRRREYTLIEGITLDTNGRTLTIENANFYNYGVIDNSASIDSSNPAPENNCGVYLNKDSRIDNYGTIKNNNVICFRYVTSEIINNTGEAKPFGTLINNGIIYCGEEIPTAIDSEGSQVNRVALTESLFDIAGAGTFVYNKEEIRPSVNYIGTELVGMDDFTVAYRDNIEAKLNAQIIITTNDFNPYYYSDVTLTFEIKRAVNYVSTEEQFVNAFSDTKNYYQVELTDDIALTQNVKVPVGIQINFSRYKLTFDNASLYFQEDLSQKTILYAEAGNCDELVQNIDNAQYISVTSDFAKPIDLSGNILDCVALNLNDSPNNYREFDTYYSQKISTFTLDLNGFDIPFSVIINKKNYNGNKTFNVINTKKEEESTIGDMLSDTYGLIQSYGVNDLTVNISDITVTGIRLEGSGVGGGINLTATNCKIKNSLTEEALYVYNVNEKTVFDNCTFSGKVCANLRKQKHYFYNCAFDWSDSQFSYSSNATVYVDDSQITP